MSNRNIIKRRFKMLDYMSGGFDIEKNQGMML